MTLINKSVPHTISYTKNPIVFAWETDNFAAYNARMIMTVSIDLGAGMAFLGRIEKRPDVNHQYVFDISDLLDAAIHEYDMLALTEHNYDNPLKLVEKTQRSYSVAVIEYYGDPETEDTSVSEITNLAVRGGVAHQIYPIMPEFFDSFLADKKQFLSWIPDRSTIHPRQPLSLFLYNWSGTDWAEVRVHFGCFFYDETGNTLNEINHVVDANQVMAPQNILIIPAGPLAADLASLDSAKRLLYYTVQVYNGEGDIISSLLTFDLDYIPRPDEKCFAYVNSLGGVDHIRTIGRMLPKIDFLSGASETDRILLTTTAIASYNPLVPLKNQFNLKESEGINVHSGPKSYKEVDLFRDFRLSPLKYELLITATSQRYVPIVIDSKSIALPKTNDYPFFYEFIYKYAFDNKVYTPNHKFL